MSCTTEKHCQKIGLSRIGSCARMVILTDIMTDGCLFLNINRWDFGFFEPPGASCLESKVKFLKTNNLFDSTPQSCQLFISVPVSIDFYGFCKHFTIVKHCICSYCKKSNLCC